MLSANEAVAHFLTDREMPMLYRVHEEPDPEKIENLREFIYNFGYQLKGKKVLPKDLQSILKSVSGKPEERAVNHVVLRSMKQAVYSDTNSGHFGLASEEYCHFTSPIRRYPDLINHRILKAVSATKGMDTKKKEELKDRLPGMGEETSRKERRAVEAERDMVSLKKVQFMADKVGSEYAGIITGVTSFGLFVELEEYFVEGLVHVSSLDDDYYHYDEKGHTLTGERQKRRFTIGNEVKVVLERVNIEKREIDFKLV
jgi:ribonuclease R